ncbi:energy coupling factor transporter S component ThiW [Neobacillus notoginsengisoli]|uniref:Energy coupling factor transporter S component ThiW n=1 Tax=Neobacillus notoginsengisoli TaxID=1578198 RepID=A0A417YYU2_9BACI|nr:energy coupling factor transporter S component ThiW [Neobacillus notoginsengisoli]RHW42697.1 energy coupling factor transporter S component ThiW [Neobacillus notoginsengisoli]
MRKTQKLTLTAMFVALGTLTSHTFYIPLGIVKAFPIQHVINVLSAVLLGPFYAVAQAFCVSLMRNMMGTGSIFAFPGSMLGALLAGVLFAKTKKTGMAFAGEVVGTGILGAIAGYPIAALFIGQEASLFGFIPAFITSSLIGSGIAFVLLKVFQRNRVIERASAKG